MASLPQKTLPIVERICSQININSHRVAYTGKHARC
jgi:hypothetical protein